MEYFHLKHYITFFGKIQLLKVAKILVKVATYRLNTSRRNVIASEPRGERGDLTPLFNSECGIAASLRSPQRGPFGTRNDACVVATLTAGVLSATLSRILLTFHRMQCGSTDYTLIYRYYGLSYCFHILSVDSHESVDWHCL